jgi:hypothetical protein
MDELIKRLEAATGPDRELDCRLWCALVDHSDFDLFRRVVPGFYQWRAAHYTASIDAALSLVPEGWFFDIRIRPQSVDRPARALPQNGRSIVHTPERRGRYMAARSCIHPRLAICIAALRARGEA